MDSSGTSFQGTFDNSAGSSGSSTGQRGTGQAAAPRSPLPATPFYAVVSPGDGVNVRPQPGSADRVGCLTQGAAVRITAGPQQAGGQSWYYAHDFGWIAGSYLTMGVAPPPSAPGDAITSVLAFYDALDRHDLQGAWALTSGAYKTSTGGNFARWAASFAATRSVIVGHVENQAGGVRVEYVAVDAGPVVSGWSVTWTTVNEGGTMRLDRSSAATRLQVCA
jgi:hypothetical protein